MRDAYDVLKEKEADLARVRYEVESLRIVTSLLLDDLNSDQSDKTDLISEEKTERHLLNIVRQNDSDLEATGTDRFWNILRQERRRRRRKGNSRNDA